jgi:glycosyltransferase involved in cell wall biosynthesis|tara:strand:- start:1186 stop:2031 length:846 start_codon:yes stop_codon:yes gene_type:complete
MKKKTKLLIFVVAYNAEKTIESVINRIPKKLSLIYDIEVLIIDDCSKDHTFKICKEILKSKKSYFKLNILYNPKNQGYGGNQKIGYHYSIKKKFDFVVLLHGDGQYAPEELPKLMSGLEKNKYDVVMGSRMINKKNALKGGMPFYKLVGNIVLTKVQNFLLNTKLAEFHTGYRIYSIKSLKKIPFHLNTQDFHFDTEILIQLFLINAKIKEISIPTFYGDEICHVNGIKYAFDVVKTTSTAVLQDKFNLKIADKYKKNIKIKKIYKNHAIDKLLVKAKKRI